MDISIKVVEEYNQSYVTRVSFLPEHIRDTSTSRFAARATEARIRAKKQRLSTRAIGATKYSRGHQLVEGFTLRLS